MNHHPRCPEIVLHNTHGPECGSCEAIYAAEQDAYADAARIVMCHQVIVNDAQKCRNIAVECAGLIAARAKERKG